MGNFNCLPKRNDKMELQVLALKIKELETENKELNGKVEKLKNKTREESKKIQKAVIKHQKEKEREIEEFDFQVHSKKLLEENRLVVRSDNILANYNPVQKDGKWVPNIELKEKYEKMTKQLGRYRELQNKVKQSKLRMKNLIEQLENCNDNDNYSKMQKIDIKQQMFTVKSEVRGYEREITKLEEENKFDELFAAWENYIEQADNFIETNHIEEFISVNNILDYQGIYVKFKQLMDGAANSSDNEEYIERLQQIEPLFDSGKAYHEARGRFLSGEQRRKELENFKTANYHEYDRLDYKETKTLPVPENSILMDEMYAGVKGINIYTGKIENTTNLQAIENI